MTHTLLDVSHWQPPIDWMTARRAGVEGVYIKVSQGASYRDPSAAQHYQGAKAVGMLVGFYHFVTNDNGIKQFDNFAAAANAIGKTDLPPTLDVETYTENMGTVYPSQDVVDVIGLRLMKYHSHVAIYTNVGFGNHIFTKPIFGTRYKIWVAHWGVSTPTLPNVWKGQPYMCWQRGVHEGAPYGVTGKVDVNEWGPALPWPGSDTLPEPPPTPDPPPIEPPPIEPPPIEQPPEGLPEFPDLPQARVTVDTLNMRKGPGVSAPRVGWLNQGDVVYVIGAAQLGSDIWLRIGHEQWIAYIYQGERYLEWV